MNMKLLKIILPIGILGIFIFMYFFKSKQQDHVFDYLPVKLSSTSNKISLIDYNGNVVAEDVFKATSKIYPTNGVITEETSEGKVGAVPRVRHPPQRERRSYSKIARPESLVRVGYVESPCL